LTPGPSDILRKGVGCTRPLFFKEREAVYHGHPCAAAVVAALLLSNSPLTDNHLMLPTTVDRSPSMRRAALPTELAGGGDVEAGIFTRPRRKTR
jgi:hypothetical protein